jgi:hypothetical protein
LTPQKLEILMKRFVSASIFTACLALIGANANANLLTNGSFESGSFVNNGQETMSLAAGSTVLTGWTVVGRSLAWINVGNPFGISAEDGNFFLDLTDYNAGAPFGGVTQAISTVVGDQYSLSFELGSYTAAWGGPPVSILASAGGTAATFTNSAITNSSTWTPFTLSFTAASAITNITLTGSAGVNYIGLDNVDVELVSTTTTPEPAPSALVALGLIGVGVVMRRRSQNAR